jgi:DNA topoisomerase VI subunit B
MMSAARTLERTTFRTSREMDFFSRKELVTQTGHEVAEWPFVIVKECTDNGLDECEEAGIAPVIEITADGRGITVKDNGRGIPEETLKGAMDFSVRVSNREAYVSPCRGAQGNALKTLLPMPWVLDPDHGRLIVTANNKRHVITCRCDPVSQRPVIDDEPEKVKSNGSVNGKKPRLLRGTEVRVEWGEREGDWPFDGLEPSSITDQFRRLVEGVAVFNPHLTITLNWFGEKTTWKATDSTWSKWRPNQPTSSHWYELPNLERLIGAYVTHDQDAGNDDRLVSDLLAEFDGLVGSAKRTKVLADAGLKRAKLTDLVRDGRFDNDRIAKLLAAMQKHTRPVKPNRLGVIGEDHLRKRLLAMGVMPESFRYSRRVSKDIAVPWVLEAAFGWLGEGSADDRRIYCGANWSAAIGNPFRSFGNTGEGLETTLAELRATRYEPVVFVLHLAHPRVAYRDRGKSALIVAR